MGVSGLDKFKFVIMAGKIMINRIDNQLMGLLSNEEQEFLGHCFERFNGSISLEDLWYLMDETWLKIGCDPLVIDERITAFYRHPVWLLNGIFSENDPESASNREKFAEKVAALEPKRVADFGGGFGSLARLIGKKLPTAEVEIVDPYPHKAAASLATRSGNARFVDELVGEYDVIIATDVFEHVPDPIGLCAEVAGKIKKGGKFLIANAFEPVILCHLPQLFHWHFAWDLAMKEMGLSPGERVAYGRFYERIGDLSISGPREIDKIAQKIQPSIKALPRGRARVGHMLTLAVASWR